MKVTPATSRSYVIYQILSQTRRPMYHFMIRTKTGRLTLLRWDMSKPSIDTEAIILMAEPKLNVMKARTVLIWSSIMVRTSNGHLLLLTMVAEQ